MFEVYTTLNISIHGIMGYFTSITVNELDAAEPIPADIVVPNGYFR